MAQYNFGFDIKRINKSQCSRFMLDKTACMSETSIAPNRQSSEEVY